MALSPTASAAPMAPPSDDAAAAAGAGGDTGADAGAPDDAGDDAPGDEDVLLTVCKESDGTYSLIKGDEQDADGDDAAGSATADNKQNFDSVGALLKAILDLLNEDKSSEGAPGDANDQFNAGFDQDSPAKPPAPIQQKY